MIGVWCTLCMNKGVAKTSRKTAVRVVTKNPSVKKSVKKHWSVKKRQGTYTSDTEIGVLMRDHDFILEGVSPKMKLGDFFKNSRNGKPFLRLLEPWSYE